jgi:hypothetical protein
MFHNGDCARSVSSDRTHKNDQRDANRKELKAYAQILARWMNKPSGKWQTALKSVSQKRGLLSECIHAAKTNDSEAKKLLVDRCLDRRLLSSHELEREIDSLLSDIRKAIDLQDAKGKNR